MATAVQVVPSSHLSRPSQATLESSQSDLRRSTRLRLRSSPPRSFVSSGQPSNDERSHGQSSRSGSPRSRPATSQGSGSQPSATKISNKLPVAVSAPGRLGAVAHRRVVGSSETKLAVPQPKWQRPRSSTKRRRGSDLTDRSGLPPSSGTLVDLEEELRTPRALRALKRRRLSEPEPSALPAPAPVADRPDLIEAPCPSPFGHAPSQAGDSDPHISSPDAVAPPLAASLENSAQNRKEQTRKLSDTNYAASGSLVADRSLQSLPEALSPQVVLLSDDDASSPSDLAGASSTLEQIPSATYANTPLTSLSDPAPPLPVSIPLIPHDAENVHPAPLPRAPTPAPIATEFKPSNSPVLSSPLSQLAFSRPSETEIAYAKREGADLPELPSSPLPAPPAAPVRDRRRSESSDTNIWKYACQERVSTLVRRYSREIVQAVVAAQAERSSPSAEFLLYTPANYSESDDDFTDIEDSLMDLDDDDDFDWDDDEDESDLYSTAMEGDAGDHIMDAEGTQGPDQSTAQEGDHAQNTERDAPRDALHGPIQIPSLPMIPFVDPPLMAPQLPRLSSIRVPHLEPCPLLTPEGKTYMGRGTPIDRQRRQDWANIRPGPFSYMTQDWLSMFLPPSPNPSLPPSSIQMPLNPESSYGVPAEVGPFSCTEQGTFGAGGQLLSSYTTQASQPTPVSYPMPVPEPASERAWLDPTLRSALTSPLVPALLPLEQEPAAPLPNFTTTSTTEDGLTNSAQHWTGCAWHSTLMQCLLASGCMPADNVDASSSPSASPLQPLGSTDVYPFHEPVEPESTLSHALG